MNCFKFKNQKLDLCKKTYIMGILNITPDSFSDGGKFDTPEKIINRAKEIEKEGADILDIGAQSTRPGFTKISAKEEWLRLAPVLQDIRKNIKIPISMDTFYPEVAKKAILLGADIINDVSGTENTRMMDVVKNSNCGLVVTHPYENLNIKSFFEKKLNELTNFGINPENICFDPGIGFGKNRLQDAYIINNVSRIKIENFPLLIGLSRKRIIAESCECDKKDLSALMAGTLAADTVAIIGGANIIRVHDVKEAVNAAKATDYLINKHRKEGENL